MYNKKQLGKYSLISMKVGTKKRIYLPEDAYESDILYRKIRQSCSHQKKANNAVYSTTRQTNKLGKSYVEIERKV